jgi:hypothetical protein
MLLDGCFIEERTMSRLMTIVEGWLMLNVALAALLVYQNSPHLRHQLFRTRIAQCRPSSSLKELLIGWKKRVDRQTQRESWVLAIGTIMMEAAFVAIAALTPAGHKTGGASAVLYFGAIAGDF